MHGNGGEYNTRVSGDKDMDYDMRRRQTLAWMEGIDRSRLAVNKMVMVVEGGRPRFVPRHLMEEDKASALDKSTNGQHTVCVRDG